MTRKLFTTFAAFAAGMVLLGGVAFAQANTSVDITVTNSATPAASRTLSFGVNTAATVDIDAGLNEQAFPPFPPSAVFEARWAPVGTALAGTEGTPNDYRPSTSSSQSDTFKLKFQPGTGGSPVLFTWSTASVSSQYTSATLTDAFGGLLGINVDMRTAGTLSISNAAITELTLIATGPISAAQGLNVTGCPLSFGIVQFPTPGTATRSLTLTRSGSTDVTLDSITSSNPDFVISAPGSFPVTVSTTPVQVDVVYTASATGAANSTITLYFDGTESTTCVASAIASSGEGIYFVNTLDTLADNSTGHTADIGLKYSGATPAQGLQFKLTVPNNIRKISRISLGSAIASPGDWVFDYQIERAVSASEATVLLYGRDTTVNLPANTDNLFVVHFDVSNLKLCNGTAGGDDTTAVMYLNSVQSALATELGESAGIGVDPNRDSATSYVVNGSARGDVNCDDRVDVLDLLVINDYILGRLDLEQWQINRADLAPWSNVWAGGAVFSDATNYGDGEVGVQDLVLLINAILNESWPDTDPLWRIAPEGGDPVPGTAPSATTKAFSKATGLYDVKFTYEVSNGGIKVEMNNVVPVKGYQMKLKAIDAPANLTITHDPSITTPFKINSAVIDGEIRIVAITANGESIAPMNGTLMNVPFSISNPNVVAVIEPITVGGSNNEPLNVDWELFAKVSGVELDPAAQAFALENAPNPFNGNTVIRYALPNSGHVTLTVTDAAGREVARLVNGVQASGDHAVEFDATNMPNGTYFYTLNADGRTATRKMVLAR